MTLPSPPTEAVEPPAPLSLGNEVRSLRKACGMTQEALAEHLGISREAISQIERGIIHRPSDAILTRLERRLGLTRARAYELMGGTTEGLTPLEQSMVTMLVTGLQAGYEVSVTVRRPQTADPTPWLVPIDKDKD